MVACVKPLKVPAITQLHPEKIAMAAVVVGRGSSQPGLGRVDLVLGRGWVGSPSFLSLPPFLLLSLILPKWIAKLPRKYLQHAAAPPPSSLERPTHSTLSAPCTRPPPSSPPTDPVATLTRTRASLVKMVRHIFILPYTSTEPWPSPDGHPSRSKASPLLVFGIADTPTASAELRRRREEAQVEIRKQKREESVAKRRNFNAPSSGADSDEEGGADSSVSSLLGTRMRDGIRLY